VSNNHSGLKIKATDNNNKDDGLDIFRIKEFHNKPIPIPELDRINELYAKKNKKSRSYDIVRAVGSRSKPTRKLENYLDLVKSCHTPVPHRSWDPLPPKLVPVNQLIIVQPGS
jgi:hypothetical protein